MPAAKKPVAKPAKKAAKKAVAKKVVPKKPAVKKAAPKPAKKAAAKKAAPKKAAKKAVAKKAAPKKAAKKAVAKKAAPKKVVAKKAVAKKAVAKKVAAKKAEVKKPAAKKIEPKKVEPTAAAKKATPSPFSTMPPPPPKPKKPEPPKRFVIEKREKKDGIQTTKEFDLKFLLAQRAALYSAREDFLGQAVRLEDEAHQLIEDAEMGDVQFDDEGGEGDTMVVERERDLALSASARETIEAIDAALARLKDGTYGYSVVSGQPIPRERLKALPWSTELVQEKVGGIGRR